MSGPDDGRAARVRELRAQGRTQDAIAALMDISIRRVQQLEHGEQPRTDGASASAVPVARRDRLLRAGLTFVRRYDEMPDAAFFNATRARDHSPERYFRHFCGWIDPLDPIGAVLPWPRFDQIKAAFGSAAGFRTTLVERMKNPLSGDEDLPVSLPDRHVDAGRLARRNWGSYPELRKASSVPPGFVFTREPDLRLEHVATRPPAMALVRGGGFYPKPCPMTALRFVTDDPASSYTLLRAALVEANRNDGVRVMVLDRTGGLVATQVAHRLGVPVRSDMEKRLTESERETQVDVFTDDDPELRFVRMAFLLGVSRVVPVSLIIDHASGLMDFLKDLTIVDRRAMALTVALPRPEVDRLILSGNYPGDDPATHGPSWFQEYPQA